MTDSQQQKVALTATAADSKKRIWSIVGASSGNLVEWFDFYVYSFFSLYFAHVFFPSGDTTTQLLQTAGVFAAGFLMRPIGGWLFGYIADRHGRKASMLISVCMMCLGSLVIACLPGYGEIGLAAPVILLLARMFQGLSVGGEYGTSATYMSEVALEGRKGFYASFQYVTLIGGQLLAVLTVVSYSKFSAMKNFAAGAGVFRSSSAHSSPLSHYGYDAHWKRPQIRRAANIAMRVA